MNLISCIIVIGLSCFQFQNQEGSSVDKDRTEMNPGIENSFHSADVKFHEGGMYFNILMLNESVRGTYSLVRFESDSSFTSIGMKDGVVNKINTPILYSFCDTEVPDENLIYRLYHIGEEVTLLKEWHFDYMDRKVVSSPSKKCNPYASSQ